MLVRDGGTPTGKLTGGPASILCDSLTSSLVRPPDRSELDGTASPPCGSPRHDPRGQPPGSGASARHGLRFMCEVIWALPQAPQTGPQAEAAPIRRVVIPPGGMSFHSFG